jgi:hypothetical protein
MVKGLFVFGFWLLPISALWCLGASLLQKKWGRLLEGYTGREAPKLTGKFKWPDMSWRDPLCVVEWRIQIQPCLNDREKGKSLGPRYRQGPESLESNTKFPVVTMRSCQRNMIHLSARRNDIRPPPTIPHCIRNEKNIFNRWLHLQLTPTHIMSYNDPCYKTSSQKEVKTLFFPLFSSSNQSQIRVWVAVVVGLRLPDTQTTHHTPHTTHTHHTHTIKKDDEHPSKSVKIQFIPRS